MFLTPTVKETILTLNEKGDFTFCQFCRKMSECRNSTTLYFINPSQTSKERERLKMTKNCAIKGNPVYYLFAFSLRQLASRHVKGSRCT